MRLLHTADWQLGMSFAKLGAAAPVLRDARFALIDRLATLAREREVDLVVVAGDVFDGPSISSSWLLEVVRKLGTFGCPVMLLPGNHDPHLPGGIWERDEWTEASADVTLLLDETPRALPELGVVVHAFPLRSAHSANDPTAALDARVFAEGAIHLGVAHGGLRGGLSDLGAADQHPIDLARPALERLDYLALGDWHSLRIERDGRVAYPGTPEPCRFGERDSGQALLVEIDGPGATPRLEPVPTATYRWVRIEAQVDRLDDAAAVARELNTLDAARTTVVEVRLTGSPDLEAIEALESLDQLAPRFLACTIDRERIALQLDAEAIAQLAPRGPLGRAVERVAEHLDGEHRRVAEEALRLFAELRAEG